ncbi:Gfo/Idh/MocA family protein [Ornithinimicrobium sediminis]|uniref:Gfo/Idh/MocA family protein n=1 Tax=Ornithinimicrobium sediminis TaxID=2904603 RepID=UPI001E33B568|nr:Gfo/Idh/MocA family oxidoreductase [Ornithinimicrobium sediminis]MCE0487394.1 Gfo/Idh/MocA family oxidoreductase [Ornithinimicrobium sediminis]
MSASTAWGVIGAARIARQQVIPAIRRASAGEILAVSSASGKAHAYAAEEGIERAYGSHEELLADPDVESVYIALPNGAHAEWIGKAVAAGKHVLCEKPIVTDPADLAAVERATANAGVVVAEAFMYRHHPQVAELRRLLTDGTLGDLVAVEARLHFALDRREGADDIRLDLAQGGGSLLDVGCYPVDLFGLVTRAEPDEVHAVAVREREGDVDTRFAGALRYGTAVATFDCSFDAPFRNTATVIGTKGAVTLSDVFRADRHGGTASLVLETETGRQELAVEGDQYAAEVSAFAGWVRQGRRDEADWALTTATTATLARLAQAAA